MTTLYIGPMFSGKTTALLTKLERASIAGKRTALLRPNIDNRDFLSHKKTKQQYKEIFTEDLLDVDISDYEIIFIDEGQFHKNLKELVVKAAKLGIDVYISALHATSESEMFEEVIDVIPFCEEIVKLNAVCTNCGNECANYTFFKGERKMNKIIIGGSSEYTALCRYCYFQEMKL